MIRSAPPQRLNLHLSCISQSSPPSMEQGEGPRETAMAGRCAIVLVGVASLLVSLIAATEDNFGYSGSNGPDKWGSLNPDYKLCSSGKNQSPVDIKKKHLAHNSTLKPLDRDYTNANATLVVSGYSIKLQFENGEKGAGSISIDGKNYTLQQLHWHSPSEHTFNDKRFPLEMHLVHKNNNGSIAVVAILFKYGDRDSLLDDLEDKLSDLEKEIRSDDQEVHVAAGEVDTKTLIRHIRKYYRYFGSLTTPPCTENVVWTILGKVRAVSKEQVAALQAPLRGNHRNDSRPTQPLNGRTVMLYDLGKVKSHSS